MAAASEILDPQARVAVGLSSSLPLTIRAAFEPVPDGAAGEAYARQLTRSHYENFSVVSAFLPRELRQDFCNVYAFCRVADDLGDEIPDRAQAVAALAAFRGQLAEMYASLSGEQRHDADATTAVFAALRETVRRHNVPMKPFDDLIRAFQQDQTVTRYDTFDQVVDYCTRSADPVGRIVLYLCGYRDEERQRLSDQTCTALQLINFWQDVRRDMLERDRIYLPADDMRRFGVTEDQLRAGTVSDRYRDLIRFEVERTEQWFDQGARLLPLLAPKYRKQIALFGKGGRAICAAVRRQKFDTLTRRPRLTKWQKARLMLGVLFGGTR